MLYSLIRRLDIIRKMVEINIGYRNQRFFENHCIFNINTTSWIAKSEFSAIPSPMKGVIDSRASCSNVSLIKIQWTNHSKGGSARNCNFGRFENKYRRIYSFISKSQSSSSTTIIGERRTNNGNTITEKSAKISDEVTYLSA